eukprot:7179838-Alexandrium_andersonii.AAC.1
MGGARVSRQVPDAPCELHRSASEAALRSLGAQSALSSGHVCQPKAKGATKPRAKPKPKPKAKTEKTAKTAKTAE